MKGIKDLKINDMRLLVKSGFSSREIISLINPKATIKELSNKFMVSFLVAKGIKRKAIYKLNHPTRRLIRDKHIEVA